MIKEGFRFDGSKAETELGITYTLIRVAIEQAMASYQGNTKSLEVKGALR